MNLILVNYINRSGSTFFLSELSKVSNFVCLPESEILVKYLLIKPQRKISQKSETVKALDKSLVEDAKLSIFKTRKNFSGLFNSNQETIICFDLFLRFVVSVAKLENPNCEWIVFKNTHFGRLFPRVYKIKSDNANLHLVSVIRDPRAIYESQKRTIGSWNRPMSRNPMSLALEWNRFLQGVIKVGEQYPTLCTRLFYEELVLNRDKTISSLLNELGANCNIQNPNANNYHNKISKNLMSMHSEINKKPNSEYISKWRNFLDRKDLYYIESTCKNLMLKSGYCIRNTERENFFERIVRVLLQLVEKSRLSMKSLKGIELPPNKIHV